MLDRPVFEWNQVLLHPELTPWWSFLFADGVHHKKPHSPTPPRIKQIVLSYSAYHCSIYMEVPKICRCFTLIDVDVLVQDCSISIASAVLSSVIDIWRESRTGEHDFFPESMHLIAAFELTCRVRGYECNGLKNAFFNFIYWLIT